jgi:hypothetical protein
MPTREERIEQALDTLDQIQRMTQEEFFEAMNTDYAYRRQNAAEEVLRHYRERDLVTQLANINVTVNGHVPVRPVVRGEAI